MRRNDREAWTAHIEGRKEKKASKYHNEKTDGFDSKKEARIARDLQALEKCGNITDLQMQVPIVIVEGHSGVRNVTYVADFVFFDADGTKHVLDVKGMKTAMYKLKKKLLFLLHNIVIEEM